MTKIMWKNTDNTYGIISRLLHWVIGISIIGLLAVGFYMTGLEPSDAKWEIYSIHKAFGFLIGGLIIFRILWRVINIVPNLPDNMPFLHQIGYQIGVRLMYILMIVMPASGVTMSLYSGRNIEVFGWFTIQSMDQNMELAKLANTIHEYSGWALAIIVSFHTLFALYHHLGVKDRLLMRIIVGK